MNKVRVTLVRGLSGRPMTQRASVRALGLRKLQQTKEFDAHPSVLGSINKVRHLLRIEYQGGDV